MALKKVFISLLFLLLIPTASAPNDYRTTYSINVQDDGSAVWYVEYRTPLVTKQDFEAFENYTEQLKPVYLKEFRELMQNSVSMAANVTSRKMIAGGFMGDAHIETAPTGNYGIVRYSFTWTDFSKLDRDKNVNIGDVFVGGLYLSKDNTLIIRYPSGYTVEQVTPPPDIVRDGLIWYGLRSFNPGEPVIILKPTFSWMPYGIGIVIAIVAGAAIIGIRRKAKVIIAPTAEGTQATEGKPPDISPISEAGMDIGTGTDMMDLEDRIKALLKDAGGSLYQSDIVKKLDLPKSTVSSALNGLHAKNMIQKIKKGRENLIRLVPSSEDIQDPS